MDCQIPLMDGYEAARQIRAEEAPAATHVTIIAPTANATKDVERRCLDSGMDAYLSKPVQPARLLACVADALGEAETLLSALRPQMHCFGQYVDTHWIGDDAASLDAAA